ncbi:MAG: hypothetical protein MUF21_11795 [Gemmatimonadaceae bacterium]|jgi:predicted nucleic acid-binding Zn ribbon protein|nr:hypothetical protein [Gemmatimonadaceae bacterium]
MDARCGDCGAPAPLDATTCAACGRTFGTPPRRRSRGLVVGAMIVAAIEVALTLVLYQRCGS